eukprot:2338135-Pyramimonas_sp.AAC.1
MHMHRSWPGPSWAEDGPGQNRCTVGVDWREGTREDARPFRWPRCHRNVGRHGSRNAGHKGTLDLA